MKQKKPYALFLLLFLVLFGISELAVRIQLKRNPGLLYGKYYPNSLESFERGNFYYAPHPYYALELNPNYILDGEKPHNRFGLRGPDIPQPKPKNEFRIACLGDSATLSVLSRKHEDTYPAQLESYLNQKHSALTTRVINGGIGTYTSADTLSSYLYKISDLNPDLLILYQGVSDSHLAYYEGNSRDYREHRRVWNLREDSFSEPQNTFPPRWLSFLSRYSKVVHKLSRVYYPYESHIWGYSLKSYELTPEQAWVKIDGPDFGKTFEKNLTALIHLAKTAHTQVLLVTFKTNGGDPVLQKGAKRLNTITRLVASQTKTPILDLEKIELPESSETLLNAMHFTNAGHVWLAKVIGDFLEKNALIPTTPPRIKSLSHSFQIFIPNRRS